jgi:cyclase
MPDTDRPGSIPEWFIPPDLAPAGVNLEPVELVGGVYALLADQPPANNSGFIVGERAVLVIDACLNGAMARQIQTAIRKVTDKPIAYLVATSNHGDHHFGAYAFPPETRVIAQRLTAATMRDFDQERAFMSWMLGSGVEQIADVKPRPADILFDQRLTVDLGEREVEIYRFGPGESPGDAVVYVRDAELAFTGNLVRAEGSVPCLLESNASDFRQTIRRFRQALPLRLIIPGHGVLGTPAALDLYEQYLDQLLERTEGLLRKGGELSAASELAEELWTTFGPMAENEAGEQFARGLHRLNAEVTFTQLRGARSSHRSADLRGQAHG